MARILSLGITCLTAMETSSLNNLYLSRMIGSQLGGGTIVTAGPIEHMPNRPACPFQVLFDGIMDDPSETLWWCQGDFCIGLLVPEDFDADRLERKLFRANVTECWQVTEVLTDTKHLDNLFPPDTLQEITSEVAAQEAHKYLEYRENFEGVDSAW